MTAQSKRQPNPPWKRIYGVDRKYTARVDRARDRGEYTEPGTPSNPPKKHKAAHR